MDYLFAALPILIVLGLMILLRWGGQRAGPAGWGAGCIIAALAFGLTPDVLWVSQLKGLFLSIFVLAVMIPALLLYHVVNQIGGIRAITDALEQMISDRGLLRIILAWGFSGMLEGLAGFGLPVAIVAPMLVGLGVEPVAAVAAVAVGHSWSVTFGDMGLIWQTLLAVTSIDGAILAPMAAGLLGISCLLCGLAAANILGYFNRAPSIIALAIVIGITQCALAILGLTPLAAFGGGVAGVAGGIGLSFRPGKFLKPSWSPALIAALASYGSLAALMSIIFLIQPLRSFLNGFMWQMAFPKIETSTGFITPAGFGQAFRFFTHPGTSILLIALLSYFVFARVKLCAPDAWRIVARATWSSIAPSSIGIFSMVGLAMLMDHSGMTILLAQAMSNTLGAAYPIAAPLVGMLGAFATGSNNNSNVLFGSLQQNAALLLSITPALLVAAQTTGGSLGSMIAPAKIVVGCSTVGLQGHDDQVMRITLPYGLLIGSALGIITLIIAHI